VSTRSLWPLDQALLLPVLRAKPRRLIVTPMEDGGQKVRLRFLGAPGRLEGTLRLTGREYDLFDVWGEDTLVKWSRPFDWHDPVGGLIRQMQFLAEPDANVEGAAGAYVDSDKSVLLVSVVLSVIG